MVILMNNKIGIKSVKFTPVCTSEEMTLEYKPLTANEVVQEMWNKLNDNEKQLVNWLIDKANRSDKAIEYIETHQLNFKKNITTFGSERLSMEERKLLDILRGVDKE